MKLAWLKMTKKNRILTLTLTLTLSADCILWAFIVIFVWQTNHAIVKASIRIVHLIFSSTLSVYVFGLVSDNLVHLTGNISIGAMFSLINISVGVVPVCLLICLESNTIVKVWRGRHPSNGSESREPVSGACESGRGCYSDLRCATRRPWD